MSINETSLFNITFANNVQLLLQQKGSKLSGAVSTGTYQGKSASPVDQVGKVAAQKVTSRYAPMGRVDAANDRRWVNPVDYDLPQLIDSFDRLKMLTQLESAYVQSAYYAMGRAQDTEILGAVFGTAKTGEQGATSTVYTSGNTAATVSIGGTNSRINVEKLITTKEKMMSQFVDFDMEDVYVAITAKDAAALLKEVQVTSADFNGREAPVLQDGKVTRFLGFNFIHCELVETLCAGVNKVTLPVWAKSGLHLGSWEGIKTSISVRNDLQSEPWQAYVMSSFGATRLEENKVYGIESYR